MRDSWASRAAFLAAALLAAFSAVSPVSAQIIVREHTVQALAYCESDHYYNPATADAPAIIAKSFEGPGKQVTFRTCTDVDGNTHYFVRKARPNRNGICRVFEEEIFPGSTTDSVIVDVLYDGMAPHWYFDMQGWKYSPPNSWAKLQYTAKSRILALESSDGCPSGDDKRYIPVGPLTDGMLKSFYGLWHRVSETPASFDEAFAGSVSIGSEALGYKQDHAELVQRLRADFFDLGRERPRIYELECGGGRLDGCSAFMSDNMVIGFDVTEHGLAITTIDLTPSI